MKKLIVVVVLHLAFICFIKAQSGISYVRKGSKSLIDKRYQKIIGKKYIEFKDGSEPGKYYVVKYDYGEPPPDQFELLKSFLLGDSIVRGWTIKFVELFGARGWTEGTYIYSIISTNDTATFFRKTYTDTLSLSYGMSDKLNITIK